MWKPIIKNPAWSGFRPSHEIQWQPVSLKEAAFIEKHLGSSPQKIQKFDSQNRKSFLVEMTDRSLLVKCCWGFDWELTSQGLELQSQAFKGGIPTTNVKQKIITMEGGSNLLWTEQEWLPHQFFQLNKSKELAQALAKVHKFLNKHPQKYRWQESTSQRLLKLKDARKKISQGEISLAIDQEAITQLCQNTELEFDRQDLKAFPIHGDMNYSNVLVSTEDNSKLYIIDFEDVYHSVLPPAFELAYILERFFVIPWENKNLAYEQGKTFLEEYKQLSPYPLEKINWLNIIQSLNLRSLCVLATIQQNNQDIPESEWKKFLQLVDASIKHQDFWRSLA